MPSELNEFECDLCLADKVNYDEFHGVALVYAMSTSEREFALCEYRLTPVDRGKAHLRETRAYREMLRSEGRKVPTIKEDALRDELFIVPGAAMSPADVVKALRDFIEQVEKGGMFIGKYKDAYIKERIAGEPRFEEG
jgi:hypothetical protein